jgi:LacI family transcriptional regulator
MIKAPPTQSDIARHCKVSRSTVAAVLGARSSTAVVSEAVRKRVLEVAESLGYRPHAAARSLRVGRTLSLALAVPNFSAVLGTVRARQLEGAGEQATAMGYSLAVCPYDETDMEASLQRLLAESRFDGVLIYGAHRLRKDPREGILAKLGVPCVSLETTDSESMALAFDGFNGARMAVEHLLEHGRRRIVYVGVDDVFSVQRFEGYKAALQAGDVAVDQQLVLSVGDYGQGGDRVVKNLLSRQASFDAMFCASDEIAMGAVQSLAERGVRVPEDVAVIGFDDMAAAKLFNPALTTVRQDGATMGREAVRMVVGAINGEVASKALRVLPVDLMVRRSCGCR